MVDTAFPFIVGCQRSGTSLLTVLFDRHSRIAMLPETHLLRPFVQERGGWQPGPTHEHLLLAAWQRDWFRLRDLQLDPLVVRERMRAHPCTPEGLLHTLLELWAEGRGKPIGGEKTPQHIEVVDRILTGIARARVTLIVRDGRAVVESRTRPNGSSRDELVSHWVECAALADRWLTQFPDRVRLIRFEDLVVDPAAVLGPLMEWYGLEFEATQLMPTTSPTFRRWEDWSKREANKPIDPDKAEAWRKGEEGLTPEQLALLEPALVRFGYPASTRAKGGESAAKVVAPTAIRSGVPAANPPILLIGAQRAGTGSLAKWLASHPAAVPGPSKESAPLVSRWPLTRRHYLELLVDQGASEHPDATVLGDPAPYYLLHPDAPRRARLLAPAARIVAVLRDPVTRAFSHWLCEWRQGIEGLTFAEGLGLEVGRLGDAGRRLAHDEAAVSFSHVHYSYALRGRYAEQLERWWAQFPAEQILVLMYEELLADPAAAWERICRHVGFTPMPAPELPHKEEQRWPLSPEKLLRSTAAEELRAALAPDTARLAELLGRALPWWPV